MKVYSIGRESGCDIVINDSTDVVSRRHAILNVSPTGKMTIVDQSHNGTYVNGIKISPNVPVPVTRKDNISFAHVARLDWNLVPRSNAPMRYAIIGVATVAIIVGSVFGVKGLSGVDWGKDGDGNPSALQADTTKQKTESEIRKELQDSVDREKHKQDSITKVKNNQQNKAKKDVSSKKDGKKTTVKKDGTSSKKTTMEEKPTKYR